MYDDYDEHCTTVIMLNHAENHMSSSVKMIELLFLFIRHIHMHIHLSCSIADLIHHWGKNPLRLKKSFYNKFYMSLSRIF